MWAQKGRLFQRLYGGDCIWQSFAILLFTLATSFCCVGCGGSDSSRIHLHGSVRVDGQPAERMLVQLHYRGPSESSVESPKVEGNDKYPLGLTDESGRFQVGDGATAGVLPGRYAVTFTWLSSDGLDAKDRFDGRYADALRTDRLLDVPRDAARPLEFDLTSR